LPSVRDAVVTAQPAGGEEHDGGTPEVLSCYYVGDAGD